MRRLARPYAIGGLIASLVGAVGAITLRIVDPVPMIPDALGFSDPALVGFEFLGVAFASVGALLVIRRPENAVGWVMVLIGAGNALAGLTGSVTSSAVADGPAGAGVAGLAAWLTNLFVMLGGLVIALGFIFPTGRGHTPAWDRFVRSGAIALLGALVFLVLIRPGPLQVFASIENPFGFGPDIRPLLGPQMSTIVAASAVFLIPILALSVVSRYRMSDRVGRQQLKWFILAFLVATGGFAAAGVGALISDEPPAAGLVVFGFAGALVPVAIGIAILRHGLYDIDRLISRTVGYAVITAVLAGVFGVAVVSLGLVLGSFAEGQTIAVAGSTLLVAALFGPLRRRAQAIVDRRFDRGSFDAAMTLEAMTARMRDDVDLDRVQADVLGVVDRTFHPATAGMWLRGDPMRVRQAAALVCLTLAIGGAVGAVVIRVVSGAPFLPAAFGFGSAAMVGFIVMGLSWASIGAFLVMRRPENAVGLVLVICGAGYALTMFFAALAFAFAAQGTERGDRLAEFTGWATLLANQVGAFGFLILFIFPTGRAQSPGWARFTRLAGLMMLVVSVIVLTQPGPLHITPSLNNPFSIGPDLRGGQPFAPLVTLFSLIAAPAIPLTLVTRYRMAGHTERQQLKWFALAGVVSIAGVAFAGWGSMLSGGSPGEIGLVVYALGAALAAVAIAIAILRHNLYDIDRIVSRTIAYALVSAIVVVVFGAVVILLSTALASFAEGQTIAVAASTLAAFAAFQPVLRRVRRGVDMRFNRARYDADQTVAEFSARLRNEVDIETLARDLDATVHGAVKPESLRLWLREARP